MDEHLGGRLGTGGACRRRLEDDDVAVVGDLLFAVLAGRLDRADERIGLLGISGRGCDDRDTGGDQGSDDSRPGPSGCESFRRRTRRVLVAHRERTSGALSA